jgi:hypothetical protein
MSTYTVDGWNNFCRIFEVPKKFSNEFCFNGGIPTNFQMVDWFYPVEDICQPTVSKEVWKEQVGPIETQIVNHNELGNKLINFVSRKNYIKPGRTYIILCDFEAIFVFTMPF